MCKKKTTEDFINDAINIHGDKYDYSKAEYVNAMTKVCIICKEHGEFWMIPNKHLNGQECPLCANRNFKYLTSEWINKAKEIHGDRYDYSKVEYLHSKEKICIICPIHGEFYQIPNSHLQGHECQKCGDITMWNKRGRITNEIFIERALKVHGGKFDYSKTEYIGNKIKVCIICPTHGEFYQTPNSHLNGCGCPKCHNTMSSLENNTQIELEKHNIEFEIQKKYKWLYLQSLDFYLSKYNIGIECQGKQHFGLGGWSKDYNFNLQQERDNKKKQLCEENNVTLCYINYDENVENKLNEILKEYGNTTNM